MGFPNIFRRYKQSHPRDIVGDRLYKSWHFTSFRFSFQVCLKLSNFRSQWTSKIPTQNKPPVSTANKKPSQQPTFEFLLKYLKSSRANFIHPTVGRQLSFYYLIFNHLIGMILPIPELVMLRNNPMMSHI